VRPVYLRGPLQNGFVANIDARRRWRDQQLAELRKRVKVRAADCEAVSSDEVRQAAPSGWGADAGRWDET
jgi:hypothetical protein